MEQNELLALANKMEGSSMDSLHFEILSASKACGTWVLTVKAREEEESPFSTCVIVERLLDRYNKEGRHYDVTSLNRFKADGVLCWTLYVHEVQLRD